MLAPLPDGGSLTHLAVQAAALALLLAIAAAGTAQDPEAEREAAWTVLRKRHDTDGNGVITPGEYRRGAEVFARLDRDRDGHLTGADFRPGPPGEDSAPRPGTPAPDFALPMVSNGELTLRLSSYRDGRPLALLFGSYTGERLRTSAERLSELAVVYGDEVLFLFVYLREAHALDSERPGTFPGTGVEDPITVDGRRALCAMATKALGLPVVAVVDRMDDAVGRAYAAYPSRLFLVAPDGRLVFSGERGPAGFDPNALELAILQQLTGTEEPAPAPSPSTRPAPAVEAGTGLLSAFDSDGDGELSPEEIDGAAGVLRSLDLDGDGRLLPGEVRRALRPTEPARSRPAPAEKPAGPAEARTEQAAAPPPVERTLESFDYDRDGRLSRIEVPRAMLERWESFDSNDDGYLDDAEQRSLKQSLREQRRR